MDNQLIKRINELAKKAKTTGLTEEEKKLQAELRKEYLTQFRSQFQQHLTNVKVVDQAGNDVTPEKLKQKKAKLKEQQDEKKTPIQ